MTGRHEAVPVGDEAHARGEVQVVRTHDEIRAVRARWGHGVAVVMTMGALHAGHAQLIKQARRQARHVMVTIFVNPLQFGPHEDLARYPRTFAADLTLCGQHGADLVLAPSVDEIYPDGEPGVRVAAGPLGAVLEGKSRPGHFDGVLTVVAKLMHWTQPRWAYFGQKDAQQVALISQMVRDLNFPVEVVVVPTVREPDGLALSSRNAYLTPTERESALALSRALAAGVAAAPDGVDAVLRQANTVLSPESGVAVDYLAVVDPVTFTPVPPGYLGPAVLAVAGRVGRTRLIDNMPLLIGGERGLDSAPHVRGGV
ncbi:MAG: pantoate--beta-alanine ligase [Actinomycetota bacterium]